MSIIPYGMSSLRRSTLVIEMNSPKFPSNPLRYFEIYVLRRLTIMGHVATLFPPHLMTAKPANKTSKPIIAPTPNLTPSELARCVANAPAPLLPEPASLVFTEPVAEVVGDLTVALEIVDGVPC